MGREQHLWCVHRFSLFKWVDASMGTTRGTCVPEKQDFHHSSSKCGGSERPVLRKTLHWTAVLSRPSCVVLCCRLYRLCHVVKTMSLTCVKHRRRRVALEEGLPFEVHTDWYWVVVTVWGTLEHKGWTSRHTHRQVNEAKVKPQPAQKKGGLGRTRRWGVLSKVCVDLGSICLWTCKMSCLTLFGGWGIPLR